MSRKSIVPPQSVRASTDTPLYVPLIGGKATIKELQITGDVDISGAIVVDGAAQLNGNVQIQGDLDLSGGLVVDGDAGNVLKKQTAFAVTRTVEIATQSFTPGITAADIGATFTVPRTGLYILNEIVTFNTSDSVGVTVGAEDSVSVSLKTVPLGPGGAGLDIKPWSIPAGEGNDYSVGATLVALLTAGTVYQAYYDVTVFAGGGVTVPTTDFTINVTSLC